MFDLSDNTNEVVIVEPPYGNTTVVRLEVEYLVETVLVGTSGFTVDLDWLILETAVVASLEATNSGVLAQFTPGSRRLKGFTPGPPTQQRGLLSSSSFIRKFGSPTESSGIKCLGLLTFSLEQVLVTRPLTKPTATSWRQTYCIS